MATPDEKLTQYLNSQGIGQPSIEALRNDPATWESLRRSWDAETVTIKIDIPEGMAGDITDLQFKELIMAAADSIDSKATMAAMAKAFGSALEKGLKVYLSSQTGGLSSLLTEEVPNS